MRKPRIKGVGHHYVHTISRVIDRRYILKENEKDYFCQLVRQQELFTGVRVVTLSVLSNHFHLLLEQVDPSEVKPLDWKELEKRLSAIYKPNQVQSIKNEYENLVKLDKQELLDEFFARFAERMHDVSAFMKEVKQKFTQWYNRLNKRKGTLWEGRFKSVIVQGSQQTLLIMAAYIDLNPVRADMVSRVEDYKWCGYTAAVGGDPHAQAGLGIILDQSYHVSGEDFANNWEETGKLYRLWLYHQGREVKEDRQLGVVGKKGFSDDEITAVEKTEGEISIPESLRKRIPCLSECKAFGSREFVEDEYARYRSTPGLGDRRYGVSQIDQGSQWQDLAVL